jgi:pimeloyl-ACP methyl ester carboxylesterase
MTVKYVFLATNGVVLHTALAGPEDGEPVILLHGFPDAWFGWEAQIAPLVEAGFRVIVPDQRGYNLSDKPVRVSSYRMDVLVEDVLGLASALGYERFHLAGHDFGAIVAWSLALRAPERLKHLAIANVPHPAVMQRFLRSKPSQILKSWYIFFFQLPRLPELVISARNWWFLDSVMPGHFMAEQRERYRQAWSQAGAKTTMINWYRAIDLRPSRSTQSPRIEAPTLVLWGQVDPYLSYEMAPLSVALCEDGQLVTFPDASHWVLHDKPKEVSDLLIDHFSEQDDDGT